MRRCLEANQVDRIVLSRVGSGGFDIEQVLGIFGVAAVPAI